MNRRYKAFTLLEILVVMGVIAILMAISAVAFISARKTARDAKRKTDLEQIRGALETYKTDKNFYPSSQFPTCFTNNGTATTVLASCLSGYITTIPDDPISTQHYYYYTPASGNSYIICASLEGGGGTADGNCANCGLGTCNYNVKNP